ncbi:MAG TPA: hypothetical protein VGH96_04505 [Streptosporangiaceae bacterium]
MSGPGDIDGEVSGDEAAWRDLIARFDVPADLTSTGTPWPAREDLPAPAASPAERGTSPAERGTNPAERGTSAAERGTSAAERGTSAAERGTSAAERGANPAERGTNPAECGTSPAEPQNRAADPVAAPDQPDSPAISFASPADRTRVIRPAGDPRAYTPAEEEDEPFVPVPLPPPAKMDWATKAALAGVIGGPGYLLVVSIFLHWTISAEAALIAVAAFVGGFVTLVVKLGDRSSRDDDDNGAVL